jgi:hypothetical protein
METISSVLVTSVHGLVNRQSQWVLIFCLASLVIRSYTIKMEAWVELSLEILELQRMALKKPIILLVLRLKLSKQY